MTLVPYDHKPLGGIKTLMISRMILCTFEFCSHGNGSDIFKNRIKVKTDPRRRKFLWDSTKQVLITVRNRFSCLSTGAINFYVLLKEMFANDVKLLRSEGTGTRSLRC